LQCSSCHIPGFGNVFPERTDMFSNQQAKALLEKIEWEEGKIISSVEGPYRYRVVVHCSVLGRQKTMFANGEHSYFCYVELLDSKGQWIERGANIVAVLPDGRFIMLVEQRPPHSRYPNRPTIAKIGGQNIDLAQFGLHGSLEFAGGAVKPGEGLKAGFLRELQEETNVENQVAIYYSRCHPINYFGSDIAVQGSLGVVFLSGLSYDKYVPNDGGLVVFALTKDEVEWNIYHGVISSGQAALLEWAFYLEVERARKDPQFDLMLKKAGYLKMEEIQITK